MLGNNLQKWLKDYLENYANENDKKDIKTFLSACEAVPQEERLTFRQVKERIEKHNAEHGITYANCHDKPALRFRGLLNPIASGLNDVTFDNNPRFYTPASCTYEFSNCDKYWFGDLCGKSLYANCVDRFDPDSMGIRLDNYIGCWKFFYFYEVKN